MTALRGGKTSQHPIPSWRRGAWLFIAIVVSTAGLGALAGLWYLRSSLPILEGEQPLAGLAGPVVVQRDALGVPTVRGSSLADVARAVGFLHAQDRFFQMDLLRRRAAGELAELFGQPAAEWDLRIRVHRLRTRAQRTLAELEERHARLLKAYAEGVNAGLEALRREPFEYLLLRTSPRPWQPEDSILVVLSMFIELTDETGEHESSLGVLHDVLPAELATFLDARGGPWDAPIVGEAFTVPPIPGPDVLDLRRQAPGEAAAAIAIADVLASGSNNWAVAGAWTAHGGALLADDMHLGLAVPNTWYRASLIWPGAQGEVRVTGVTLPGTPLVVVGSNGRVAWGFTNSYGDYSDLVILEQDQTPAHYRTPQGVQTIEKHAETIRVKGAAERRLEVEETIWGPVVDQDHRGRRRALRWTAHDPEAINLGLVELAAAGSVDEAIEIATRTGIPPQNFVVADRSGRIGWTIMGRIPRRLGCDGRLPTSWSDGGCRWEGFLAPEEVPRVVNPPGGRIWTANSRVVDEPALSIIGDGGYVLGARAQQIRDRLLALDKATEADMLAVQLDDRAVFLTPWRERLLAALTPEVMASHPRLAALQPLVAGWSGRASVEDAGYRYVRAFRLKVLELALAPLLAPCRKADSRFQPSAMTHAEEAVVRLLEEQPPHLLDPRFASWHELLVRATEEAVTAVAGKSEDLASFTWGKRNTLAMAHPLSRAIPALAPLLDMPREALPGDWHMPRVQGPAFGASERLVVSPGKEERGIFHMPGGQSGHPLSPFYRAGHAAWAQGEATPFLPGPTIHTLTLVPAP
jgi:penicillin amidase